MQMPAPFPANLNRISPPAANEPRLRGGALLLARGAWLLLAAGLLASFIISIPAYYGVQHGLCDPVHCVTDQPTPGNLLALQRLGLSLDDFALYTVIVQVVASLAFLAVGALIFWRKSSDWLGLSVSFLLVLLGCSGIFGSLADAFSTTDPPLPLDVLAGLGSVAQVPALGTFVLIFPTGRFTPRWAWVVSVWWAAQVVFFSLPAPYNFDYWPGALVVTDLLLMFVSPAAIQVYRYRRVYTPTERQQTKWLVFGFGSAALFSLLFIFMGRSVPGLSEPDSLFQLLGPLNTALVFVSVPFSVGVAVLRYRLWDIDTIINKALVYALLTALLGALYAGLIIGLTSLADVLSGGQASEQPLALVISTLAIAALFLPVRRRIQQVIDRRFYRRKYDAEKTLAAFSAALRNEVNLEQVREQLLGVVQETMQPAHVSLWLRQPERRGDGPAQRLEGGPSS